MEDTAAGNGRNQLCRGERLRTLGKGPNEGMRGRFGGCGGPAVLQERELAWKRTPSGEEGGPLARRSRRGGGAPQRWGRGRPPVKARSEQTLGADWEVETAANALATKPVSSPNAVLFIYMLLPRIPLKR